MAEINEETIKRLQQELLAIDRDNDLYKIDDEVAKFYLQKNHNNRLNAINDIITELFMNEEQPSPKRQRSKKRESPSSVIDLEGLAPDLKKEILNNPDLMQALLNSLEGPQFIKEEAKIVTFNKWINKKAPSENSIVRQKLMHLFNGKRWKVVNPTGDGFCGIYVAAIDFQNKPNADPEVLDRVNVAHRADDAEHDDDALIELILDGIKNYYIAQQRHCEKGIPLPPELKDGPNGKYFNIDDRIDAESNVRTYFDLTLKYLLTHEAEIRQKLNVLGTLSNTPESVFIYLPYIYKRNYLILTYDHTSVELPFVTTFMPCYADVELDEYGTPIYPHNVYTNSVVLYNDGHYHLLYNPDTTETARLVDYVITNKETPNVQKVWHGFVVPPTARGRVRKLKSRKQNYRIQQSKKKKTRKQHYRKQKSRKQQPKKQKNKTKTNNK